MQEEPKLAREIGPVGYAPDGAIAITTFSQAQIDELVSRPGKIGWGSTKSSPHELTLVVVEPEWRPLATFDLRKRDHRRALEDVLRGGTLYLCARDSLNEQTGNLEGAKFVVDIEPGDCLAIEIALKGRTAPEST